VRKVKGAQTKGSFVVSFSWKFRRPWWTRKNRIRIGNSVFPIRQGGRRQEIVPHLALRDKRKRPRNSGHPISRPSVDVLTFLGFELGAAAPVATRTTCAACDERRSLIASAPPSKSRSFLSEISHSRASEFVSMMRPDLILSTSNL
jgi:hypothetical protein